MSLLHVHYTLRNQQAFQRLLDASPDRTSSVGSSSGGKSWPKATSQAFADVNALDSLGRTVLHRAVSAHDPQSLEYVKLLLRHPAINVNIHDKESRWTALHRALYNGNISAAVLLLKRSDIDVFLKDIEGYTAFDVFNSTVEGTNPSEGSFELYTWGANRNAALGLGDADDRAYPDQVIVPSLSKNDMLPTSARLVPIQVTQIEMSKLHTVLVTSEPRGNIRLCGFGSGGRLGPGNTTQYTLKSIPLSVRIVSVAAGQDHTLALSEHGEVYSWGLNRFSQLGYVVEVSKLEEPVQASPRKIQGPLKKEFIRGIAASKSASACWTENEVFTWGTNGGQLGYDKAAQPVQLLPRKVSKITKPVIAVALSDTTLTCLLESKDVICLWNDRSIKIAFPTQAFPSDIGQPYRPPQAVRPAHIEKITHCEEIFAALSSTGEVFTFSSPSPSQGDSDAGKFKPQRVWALRRQFSAVKDVAIGCEGSIIVCTESGHVFIRSRAGLNNGGASSKSNTAKFKFQRVPYIHRATNVCANVTGAYGALRVETSPPSIIAQGQQIWADMMGIRPYASSWRAVAQANNTERLVYPSVDPDSEIEDGGSNVSVTDLRSLAKLFEILFWEELTQQGQGQGQGHEISIDNLPLGADILVQTHSNVFPVHHVMLVARSPILRLLMANREPASVADAGFGIGIKWFPPTTRRSQTGCLEFTGCHSLTVLTLLDYVYSDQLIAIWDRRVSLPFESHLRSLNADVDKIRAELRDIAALLQFPQISIAVQYPSKRALEGILVQDLSALHNGVATTTVKPDVILHLADKAVSCYSIVLRARSSFFAIFFGEEVWTSKRRDANGIVHVDMRHLEWHPMQYVLRFLCCGEDKEMFSTLDFVNSIDEVIEFMFDVLSAANEILLERLILICSSVIIKFTNLSNACFVLTEATHFHVPSLIESVQTYMVTNLETLLESRMLDGLDHSLMKQFSSFVSQKQMEKMSLRSGKLVQRAMEEHKEWLESEDFPTTIIPSNKPISRSPKATPRRSNVGGSDDIFDMDDMDSVPSAVTTQEQGTAWKATVSHRVDMRTVMAQAANQSEITPRGSSKASAYKAPQRKVTDIFGPSTLAIPTSTSPYNSALANKPVNSGHISSLPNATPMNVIVPPVTPPRHQGPPGQQFGPIFTPGRQASRRSSNTSPSLRRVSSSTKAWNSPAPSSTSPVQSTSGMSFADIQQAQLEQNNPKKDKRSLLQIQREEEELRQEEEFLRWWAAEEERVKLDEAAAIAALTTPSKKPSSRRPKKAKRTLPHSPNAIDMS